MKGQHIKETLDYLKKEKLRINSETVRIRNLCQHEEITESQENYVPECYWHEPAYTIYYKKCNFCGKVVETKRLSIRRMNDI